MQSSIIFIAFVHSAFATFDEDIHKQFKSLPQVEFVEYFNKLNTTWKVQQYDVKELAHRVSKYVGETEHLPKISYTDKKDDLPVNFDARKKWAKCPSIGKIFDQGQCGSSWAFGVTTTISDRMCIHANQTVQISERDIQCCKHSYSENFCSGGLPSGAFLCWMATGLVSQECKPYNVEKLKTEKCTESCDQGKYYKSDKYYGRMAYQIAEDPVSIKWELVNMGPIDGLFIVYEDFLTYSKGIYEHKFGAALGVLSVRIIGYGEENGVLYWLAANSWGKSWGEGGFFKIRRYQPNLYFEYLLLSGIPSL
ncbi:cathepsin B-like [Battus philenor]|uniref:cathepsin B-like n=1 Tax=Battus philenor TaxID=42288 RepID=UPI0035D06D75